MRLIEHAEREMRIAGLYDADSDYAGMIPEAVMKLIRPFSEEGHSGMSAELTLEIFNRLARYKTLTAPTCDPSEWMEVSGMFPVEQRPVFQSKRDPSLFSNDGGKTYYSVDDKERTIKNSSPTKP